MPALSILNGDIILKDRILKRTPLSISGAKISSMGSGTSRGRRPVTIDAAGCFVSPGFIDTHIHGSPAEVFRNEIPNGTTSAVIAVSCGTDESISENVRVIKDFISHSTLGPNVLGIRLEGPYINSTMAGAQDRRFIKEPDAGELCSIIAKCGRLLKIMTVAPELEDAGEMIRILTKKGVIASMGHSDASCEEATRGIRAGARHLTHIFNRTGSGVIDAALKDRKVWAEAIFDLKHVKRDEFAKLMKAKGEKRTILVTDSVKAVYRRPADRDGLYRLKDGTVAGSSLTMIGAVKNAVRYGRLGLIDAIRLAAFNPATLLGIERRKDSLEPGKDADLVIFDRNFEVKLTMISGRIAYKNCRF
jgi:N-acetylglucosamine-6-phosphate deacetylase